mgnify:CR=1 FL=1
MTAGYHTLRELQEQAVLQNREVWEIVRNADMSENERSAEASFGKNDHHVSGDEAGG